MPPSVVVLGVSRANHSHRRPAIGRFSFWVCETTCDISVFSVSTIAAAASTVTASLLLCTGREKFNVSDYPTCRVSPVRTLLANPDFVTVIS